MPHRHYKEQTSFDTALSVGGTIAALDGLIAGNPADPFRITFVMRNWQASFEVDPLNIEETYTPQWEDGKMLNTDLAEHSLGDLNGAIIPDVMNNSPQLEYVIPELNTLYHQMSEAYNNVI